MIIPEAGPYRNSFKTGNRLGAGGVIGYTPETVLYQ